MISADANFPVAISSFRVILSWTQNFLMRVILRELYYLPAARADKYEYTPLRNFCHMLYILIKLSSASRHSLGLNTMSLSSCASARDRLNPVRFLVTRCQATAENNVSQAFPLSFATIYLLYALNLLQMRLNVAFACRVSSNYSPKLSRTPAQASRFVKAKRIRTPNLPRGILMRRATSYDNYRPWHNCWELAVILEQYRAISDKSEFAINDWNRNFRTSYFKIRECLYKSNIKFCKIYSHLHFHFCYIIF